MLKSKTIITTLLLTLSFNAFAFCVHNHTTKPIFFSSDQDWVGERKNEIVPGNKYCTKEGESGFGYTIFDGKTNQDKIICGALWTNISLKNIDVVSASEHCTCIAS